MGAGGMRNPSKVFDDTEFELWMRIVEATADRTAKKAVDEFRTKVCPEQRLHCETKVASHDAWIFGDGERHGADVRLDDVEEVVKDWQSGMRRLTWLVIGSLFTAVTSLTIAGVVWIAGRLGGA